MALIAALVCVHDRIYKSDDAGTSTGAIAFVYIWLFWPASTLDVHFSRLGIYMIQACSIISYLHITSTASILEVSNLKPLNHDDHDVSLKV